MKSLPSLLAAGLLFLMGPVFGAEALREPPACPLKAWDSDRPIELRQFRGKVVYVDFWASWCTTCVQSFPFLNRLHADLADRGLVVLGINVDERPQDAVAFLARNPVAFMQASAPGMVCPKAFALPGMPISYLIDRQGMIRRTHLGFRPGDVVALRQQLEQLLDEPAPAREAQ